MTIARRTLTTTAWAAPALIIATAAPAIATSTAAPARIRFTNNTATQGEQPNTIYTNTKITVTDGPEPITDLTITIHVEDHDTHTWNINTLAGWATTELLTHQWTVTGRNTYTITFTATHTGTEPITHTTTVHTPHWWTSS